MPHRLPLVASLLLCVTLSHPAAARAGEPAYPVTVAGGHARDYFAAYNAGEAAMREFWTTHGSPAALAERPVEPRLGVWREIHAGHGALTPLRVTGSGDDFVEVLARDEHGGAVSIRFACEPGPAHGLVALRFLDGGDAGSTPPTPPIPPPAETGPPPTDAEIVARLGSMADSLAGAGAFSGAITLDRDGHTLFARAYGMASRAPQRPNTIETRFNLGSINKIFTHVAIEQLAQQGGLKLDDTLDRFLPDYPRANASRITLRMLLDHRAGVPDVLENPALWKDPSQVRTLADWYALVRDMPLRFDPGTRQEYSNGGFVLLGAVIAKVSGEDYYDYIRRHVYRPAGMTRSEHLARNERLDERASGYTSGEDMPPPGGDAALAPTTALDPAHALGRGSPAGGGYSTVGDLVRFGHALRGRNLLDDAHTRDMIHDPASLGIASGSPGVNGLLIIAGPYTLAVLANLDPPAAERFAPTVGRMVRRAAGVPPPVAPGVRPGGPGPGPPH